MKLGVKICVIFSLRSFKLPWAHLESVRKRAQRREVLKQRELEAALRCSAHDMQGWGEIL